MKNIYHLLYALSFFSIMGENCLAGTPTTKGKCLQSLTELDQKCEQFCTILPEEDPCHVECGGLYATFLGICAELKD